MFSTFYEWNDVVKMKIITGNTPVTYSTFTVIAHVDNLRIYYFDKRLFLSCSSRC